MNSGFRVLHLTSSKNRSGGTRQAVMLACGQRAAGSEVHLAAVNGAAALTMAEATGVPTLRVPCGSWRSLWSDSRQLRRTVQRLQIDVVHTHHTMAHNLALLASFGGSFPPIVVNRGVLFRPGWPAKFCLRRNAAFTTNSEAVKRTLVGCGVDAASVHVVYNAAPPIDRAVVAERTAALAQELDIDPTRPVIGTVGRGRPEKGFQVLVAAAPLILRRVPEATFLLVGSGTAHLREQIRGLGLDDRFRLTGHRRDAVDIMGLLDLFVIPSLDMDSCPNVLLEAMALGLPAVGTTVGGIPEIIVDGNTGRVVAPGDAAGLAAAVAELIGDPVTARQLGENARRRIERDFSLQAKVQRTLAVYAQVVPR